MSGEFATHVRSIARILPHLCVFLWLLVVGAGMFVLLDYANTPGRAGMAAARWPDAAGRAGGRAKLVMALHPHCPCSRASIGELALIMARCQGRLTACVLFVGPAELGPGWMHTDLWESAMAIPGVECVG